jgi:sigma-B regulation protein RsbU (phosphoserine phosphatase)
MAVARTLIRSHAHAGMSAMETVGRTNDLLLLDADQSGMFVTLYFSRFMADGSSIHVNGGHNPPVYYHYQSGNVELMPIGGRALGWFPNNPLQEVQMKLDPGDVMVFYTDGLTEAENPEGEAYGEQRLMALISTLDKESADEIKGLILDDVAAFCDGQSPFDDLTMLVVRYMG